MPRVIWGPGWLESLSLLLGALILSDHGNTIWTTQYSIFLQMVFIIAFASMLFSWFVRSLLLLDFFVSTSIFFLVQPMIFDPPFNPEESAWFTFSLLTSWSNQGARIKSVRFVRELLSPFLTVMVYKTTASGLAKASFMLKHGRYLCIIYLLYYWYTYQDHNPADGITATEVQIFLIAGNMN